MAFEKVDGWLLCLLSGWDQCRFLLSSVFPGLFHSMHALIFLYLSTWPLFSMALFATEIQWMGISKGVMPGLTETCTGRPRQPGSSKFAAYPARMCSLWSFPAGVGLRVTGILISCDRNRSEAPSELLRSFLSWLHSAVVQMWLSCAEVCTSHDLLQWLDLTDREETFSASILTQPNCSQSPPDKRASVLPMISSGGIWKVKVSYLLFLAWGFQWACVPMGRVTLTFVPLGPGCWGCQERESVAQGCVSIWRVTVMMLEPVAESGNFTKYLFLGSCVVILCMSCVSR